MVKVAQTRLILEKMKGFLEQVGGSVNAIVRTDSAFTHEVNGEQSGEMAGYGKRFWPMWRSNLQ